MPPGAAIPQWRSAHNGGTILQMVEQHIYLGVSQVQGNADPNEYANKH
jgi:hypothetical protein